jgi:hypothetical protein
MTRLPSLLSGLVLLLFLAASTSLPEETNTFQSPVPLFAGLSWTSSANFENRNQQSVAPQDFDIRGDMVCANG